MSFRSCIFTFLGAAAIRETKAEKNAKKAAMSC